MVLLLAVCDGPGLGHLWSPHVAARSTASVSSVPSVTALERSPLRASESTAAVLDWRPIGHLHAAALTDHELAAGVRVIAYRVP
jgi:hypothetical protein